MGLGEARHQTGVWLAGRHPSSILYGIIITGAVMSATAGGDATARRIVAATPFVLGVYWLADVYVRAFAQQFREGRQPLGHRIVAAASHESGCCSAAFPRWRVRHRHRAGASPGLAADVALWLTVVLLGSIAYLAARYAGSTVRDAVVEAALAAALGILMIVSKSLLH